MFLCIEWLRASDKGVVNPDSKERQPTEEEDPPEEHTPLLFHLQGAVTFCLFARQKEKPPSFICLSMALTHPLLATQAKLGAVSQSGWLLEIIVPSFWLSSSESEERKRRESSRDLSGSSLTWPERGKRRQQTPLNGRSTWPSQGGAGFQGFRGTLCSEPPAGVSVTHCSRPPWF